MERTTSASTSMAMKRAEYNIIDTSLEGAAQAQPAIREAIKALRPGYLPEQPDHGHHALTSSWDIMDWLGFLFGFQADNVRNQREHVILLLANHTPPRGKGASPSSHSSTNGEQQVQSSITFLHIKMLENYRKWCSFLGRKHRDDNPRFSLVYPCLFLLIWGEASNLRFMPECLCYIFHHMVGSANNELKAEALQDNNDKWPKAFLKDVISPIYKAISREAEGSKKGTAPHSSWRNYDDMNEFFWSDRCFSQLGWPLELASDYLVNVPIASQAEDSPALERLPSSRREKEQRKRKLNHKKTMGFKVGFVEQRTFWSIFHSFPRLWIAQLLLLQILITFAFLGADGEWPWQSVLDKDNQIKLLYGFITWAALLTLHAFLTIILQFSLLSRDTKMLALRMVLKLLAAMGWTATFSIMIARIEEQRARDPAGSPWSERSNLALFQFLKVVGVFLLPELAASLLFFMPAIANAIENCDGKAARLLSWWFYHRTFVGRGLHQDLASTFSYTLFWVVVLAAKVCFSYTVQIRQLVGPTHDLLRLKHVQYQWYVFFGTGNRFEAFLLWLPVLLIYSMDVQIWYSIFSSLLGVTTGLFSRIGDIRNMQQLRLRFPFFAGAVSFHLMPNESESGSLSRRDKSKLTNTITRLWMTYGCQRHYYQRLTGAPKQPQQFRTFASLWNRVINLLRKEDLLSSTETELLKIPQPQDIIPMARWPLAFLSNELTHALRIAIAWKDDHTRNLWDKIGRDEYRKSAVLEAFYTLKYILLSLYNLKHAPVKQAIDLIEEHCKSFDFLPRFKVKKLEQAKAHVVVLLKLLLLHRNHPSKEIIAEIHIAYLNVVEVLIRDLPETDPRPSSQCKSNNAGHGNDQFDKLSKDLDALDLNALDLNMLDGWEFQRHVKRIHFMLTREENTNGIPRNLEARRRLAFFGNSLFMNLPRAPLVEWTTAFSVLIPHYDEDVLYQVSQLDKVNEDGITIMYYLQKVFPDEWDNFQERQYEDAERREEDPKSPVVWASYRGQTLARTVRGMMYYKKALELLAHLENVVASSADESSIPVLYGEEEEGRQKKPRLTQREREAALLKFSLVVASQIYGELKRRKDAKAEHILWLMRKYPAMRVAYVDEEGGEMEERKYYSVLVKCDGDGSEAEVYRILLPGPFLLGEGKPENQNQAIVYTRGEALQAIDMNQEGYFEEALKMRNLLQELDGGAGRSSLPRRILGIREHVFTGSVSSLAFFMSAQESSFVTLGQRVLAAPLRVRMHYGHPDVFDRLWFVARGGVSKASKAINISEDIYAGMNCTLRGGLVTHHEYMQVGKGRDLGLNQIAAFEAKVSGGNAEQTLSRDVHRLGHCLDALRMTSFYYTSVGFYFNSFLIVMAAFAYMWSRVYLGLSGIEHSFGPPDSALLGSLDQQFVLQIGILTSVPLLLENSLEHGLAESVWRFLLMQLQLSSVFYTFSLGTKAHFYGRTLLHGGARYRGTGRGFVIKCESFVRNYCLYSRSHFVKGIELAILLIIYEAYGFTTARRGGAGYVLTALSFWFLALSWILGPFLFNPSGFEWLRTVEDYGDLLAWLWQRKGTSRKADESWEAWWSGPAHEHLVSSGPWARLAELLLNSRFFLLQYGMVYRLRMAAHNKSLLVYLVSWTYIVTAVMVYIVVARAADKYAAKNHIYYRCLQLVVLLFVAMVIFLLALLTDFGFLDLFVSMLAFLPTGWGLLSMAVVLKPYLEDRTQVWAVVLDVARLYDLTIALIVLFPVALLSWLPGFQSMQTRLLFNLAFGRGLQISKLLTGKKSIVSFSSAITTSSHQP